jgi:hypothetical protein
MRPNELGVEADSDRAPTGFVVEGVLTGTFSTRLLLGVVALLGGFAIRPA